jgi:hypothetical protein
MEAIGQAPVYGRLGRNEANSSQHPELQQSTVASHEDDLKEALWAVDVIKRIIALPHSYIHLF